MKRVVWSFAICLPVFFALYLGTLFGGAWLATRGDAERDAAEQAAWKRSVYRDAYLAERPVSRGTAVPRETILRPIAGPVAVDRAAVPRETGRRAPGPVRDANAEAARRAAACHGHNCSHDVRPQVPAWTPYAMP